MPKQNFLFAGIAGHARGPEDKYLLGTFRRDTGGCEWEHVLTGAETFTVLVHPVNPNLVFAGTSDGVYFSVNRGETFQRAAFPEPGFQVWSILVDPRNSRLLYAGCSPVAVFRSEDSGASWTRLPEPAVPSHTVMPFPSRIMRMAAHPHREGEIYAVLEANGVMRSKDGGESWQDCSTDLIRLAQQPHLRSRIVSDTENEGMLDGHAICTTSADPDAIIVAVRMGLFRSSDEGEHWEDMDVSRFSPSRYSRDIHVVTSEEHGPALLQTRDAVAGRRERTVRLW